MNILIMGGGLHNKGAESMLYITCSRLYQRYPDCNLFVTLNNDVDVSCYRFKTLSQSFMDCSGQYALGGYDKRHILYYYRDKYDFKKGIELWKSMDMVLDISGFAIGDQWGIEKSLQVARRSYIAKKYHAFFCFLPQSFGPFEFKTENTIKRIRQIKKYLSKADIIYAREKQGLECLKQRLKLRNVISAYDMVLSDTKYIKDNIYDIVPDKVFTEYSNCQSKKRAAIVPSDHITNRISEESGIKIYSSIVDELIKKEYDICIIPYSKNDRNICNKIYLMYENANNVTLFDENISAFDIMEIMESFQLVVSSRYHAVIHSYRKGVPCFVIGWADKYAELMHLFNQQKYCVSITEDMKEIDVNLFTKFINELTNSRKKIEERLSEIQKEDVFERIFFEFEK